MQRNYKVILLFLGSMLLSLGLVGCGSGLGVYAVGVTYMTEKELEEEMQFLRAGDLRENGASADVLWNVMLGDTIAFLPADYRRQLTRDRDTFLKTAMGYFLSKNPGLSYKQIQDLSEVAKRPVPFTREEFDYYRGYGKAWSEAVKDDPENEYIHERYDLFMKRVGTDELTPHNYFQAEPLRDLLRSDEDLQRFLTDDDYAATWVNTNLNTKETNATLLDDSKFLLYRHSWELQPILVPILPGLAS